MAESYVIRPLNHPLGLELRVDPVPGGVELEVTVAAPCGGTVPLDAMTAELLGLALRGVARRAPPGGDEDDDGDDLAWLGGEF